MTFRNLRRVPLPEIQCTLVEVEHEPTGARIVHLECDDEENLFCLSLRTYPKTSNGVAHILEHTVLCGSEHFPVRDPFFSMTRRSLNTFMNAFTGGDFTCYPAATQIPQDFYNLLAVYADAVFHPRLLKTSFLQEGHRLEFEDPTDPRSPLRYKGIVYNEMKGALATGEARLSEALMESLYPDITYGINSGGDPREITHLTYEELKAFHQTYYHPSHCLFFFYGNLPLQGHLDFLEKHVFDGVERAPTLPLLPKQPRFTHPKRLTRAYPSAEEEAKTLIGLAWLTCGVLDQESVLALSVLDILLMGTDASPLKAALLESDLCKQADAQLEVEMSEVPYCLVCRGCEPDAAPAIEAVVLKTLTELSEQGFDPELVEGAVHQLELARSEITGDGGPFGLTLYFRAALLAQHGGRPEDGLQIHSLFARLRKRLADPAYLSDCLRRYFLNNRHSVLVTLVPDPELGQKESEQETEALAAIQAKLTDQEAETIVKEAEALALLQETEESTACLPKITLSDVPQQGKEFALETHTAGTLTAYHHPCFTNGLLYADLVFPLPNIAPKRLPWVRLFAHLLPQVGCGGKDYKAHLDEILKHTGGVGSALDLSPQAHDPHDLRPSLSVQVKGLTGKAPHCFRLLKEIAASADFTDKGRLEDLLKQHFHSVETSLHRRSLSYALQLAGRGQAPAAYLQDCWFGLHYYEMLCTWMESDLSVIIQEMERLQAEILGLEGRELVLSTDPLLAQTLTEEAYYGLGTLPAEPRTPWKNPQTLPESLSQGRITNSPVAFTALLFPSVPYTDPASPALSLASELMDNLTLHTRIREQGGAYGGGSANNALTGQFYFYAYRDPHIESSVAAFHEAAQVLADGDFSEEDIEEAKLGIFQDLDSPVPPGKRALAAYNRRKTSRTPERRQAYREGLRQADRRALIEAARTYLLPGLKKGCLATFAAKELLEKETTLPIFEL